jgi:WASH complex subunit strumpellin
MTGYMNGGKRPLNYPEEFFGRFKVPRAIVSMIIARLRSDDIYNHTSAYPAPGHRSTALATQSAMLYVILFFEPETLNGKEATMREIVDKHFTDNWVLPIYMGCTVDLSDAWTPYKAASRALNNILQKGVVAEVTGRHAEALVRLNADLDKLLTEVGSLSHSFD